MIPPATPTLGDTVGRRSDLGALIRSLLLMARFSLINVFGRRSVIDPTGPSGLTSRPDHARPVVSLTSYGRRVPLAFLAIESIARGSLRPSRLVLWLDDPRYLARPPRSLRRLVRRGLEVKASENYGPHTKYYPYARSRADHELPLVTADDDWMVPREWLSSLIEAHSDDKLALAAHRAHRIAMTDGGVAPYATWSPATLAVTSPLHFGTGCMGQLITPRVLDALRDAGDSFRQFSPHNDDVWIHHTALELGVGVRPVGLLPESDFAPVRGAGLFGVKPLFESNVAGGRNDRQIEATYTARGVSALLDASGR